MRDESYNDLKAEGLNVSITALMGLGWLQEFLTKNQFSYPAAEKDRKFALIILQGLYNKMAAYETLLNSIERIADAEAEIASEYDHDLERGRARAYAEIKKRVAEARSR